MAIKKKGIYRPRRKYSPDKSPDIQKPQTSLTHQELYNEFPEQGPISPQRMKIRKQIQDAIKNANGLDYNSLIIELPSDMIEV